MSDQTEIIVAILGIIGSFVSGLVLVWRMVVARQIAAQEHEEELQRKRIEWDIERQRQDDAREKAFENALMEQTSRAQSMLETSFERITQLDKEKTAAIEAATYHMEKRAEAETKLEEKQAQIEAQMTALAEARKELLEASHKVGQLEGAQKELKEQVDKLQSAHAHLQKEFSRLTEQKRDLEAQNKSLEQERDRLNTAIAELNAKFTNLEAKYNQLALDYTKLAKDYEELKARYEQDKANPDNNRVAAVPADSVPDMGTIPPHTN